MIAGVSCSGPSDHEKASWAEFPGRRIAIRRGNSHEVIDAPVPGEAGLVAFDVTMRRALLADGTVWRKALAYDPTKSADPYWRGVEPAVREGDFAMSKKEPVIIAAGAICGGGLWYFTPDRRGWALDSSGRGLVADAPVPGSKAILAFDVSRRTVLLEGGERIAWIGGRWHTLANLLDATSMMRVRFLSGITINPGRDVYPGDVLELSEGEARVHIARGIAQAVGA